MRDRENAPAQRTDRRADLSIDWNLKKRKKERRKDDKNCVYRGSRVFNP